MKRKIYFSDLRRNDTAAALAYAKQESAAGRYTPEVAEMLIMLQDYPDRLRRLLAKANLRVIEPPWAR